MKNVIFSAIAALFLLGMNVQAETISFDDANQKILNGLQEHGYLNGLSDSEMRAVEGLVASTIAQEFGSTDSLNLSEESQQAFILSTIKSIGSKIVSGVKTIGSAVIGAAKTIAAKAGPLIQQYGPQLMSLASKALPVVAPMAQKLAGKLGLPVDMVKGALAKLSPAQQQAAANDENLATKAVADATNVPAN